MTGVAGAAVLATAYWLQRGAREVPAGRPAPLDEAGLGIVSALVPVMLDGLLPTAPEERERATADTATGVRDAIAGLPPHAQRELAELFALLAWSPARRLLAGFAAPWPDAAPAAIDAALQRWRTSRIELLRSAYGALHQLIFAAWYGQPRTWPAIGYPGPPSLSS